MAATAGASPTRVSAMTAGSLFLVALVSSLVGGGLLEAALGGADALTRGSAGSTQVLIGVLLELINGIAVIFIALLLVPILRRRSEIAALGYVGLRIVEGALCAIAAAIPLSLIGLTERRAAEGIPDGVYDRIIGDQLILERTTMMSLLVPLFFSLGAVVLYTAAYQARLIPRALSIWGLVGVALVAGLNVLGVLGVHVGTSLNIMLALPIILNEVCLGIWLIVKGWTPTAATAGPVQWARTS